MCLLSTQNNFNTVKIYGYEKFYKFTHLELGQNCLTWPMGEYWKHFVHVSNEHLNICFHEEVTKHVFILL